MFTSVVKASIKYSGEQADEEMHRARSGRAPHAEPLSPRGPRSWRITLAVWTCTTWRLSKPTIGISWSLPHTGMMNEWLQSSPSPPNGAENSKLLIMARAFRCLVPIQALSSTPEKPH